MTREPEVKEGKGRLRVPTCSLGKICVGCVGQKGVAYVEGGEGYWTLKWTAQYNRTVSSSGVEKL